MDTPSEPAHRTRAKVRVPCSTSNLGPGFDQLGLALSLFLEVALERTPGASGPPTLEAPPGWPGADEDLIVRALFDRHPGLADVGLRIQVASEIPLARGLGSSGAAVAAGLLLAGALGAPRESERALLERGIRLEGHPDNVTASLLGGLTLCVPTERGPFCIRPKVHPSLGIAAAWPEMRFPTAAARGALPQAVPHRDAVENARRLPLLLEGLARGDGEWIAAGSLDRLHEPYRLPLLPGSKEALEAARRRGAFAANLSGSGSALVAIAPRRLCETVAEAMALSLRSFGAEATARVLEVVLDPPAVEVSKEP